MKKVSFLWLVSLLTLSITASEFVEQQNSSDSVQYVRQTLQDAIVWNHRVANVMPFLSAAGSAGLTFTALRIADDFDGDNDSVVLPMMTFLALSGPILLSQAASKIAKIPKYMLAQDDDTVQDLQEKVKESDKKITMATEFGVSCGVGLLGTGIALTETLGILLGFVRCSFDY